MRVLHLSYLPLLLAAAVPLSGQAIPASQFSTVTQSVAGAELKVEYSRPKARGRQIVGGLIKYGKTWTPGANWATTFETPTEIRVNGEVLPAGKYSLWVVASEEGAWAFIFSREWEVYHVAYPGKEKDELRLQVEPREVPHMENLTFNFAEVEQREATLEFRWGTVALPLELYVGDPAEQGSTSSGQWER